MADQKNVFTLNPKDFKRETESMNGLGQGATQADPAPTDIITTPPVTVTATRLKLWEMIPSWAWVAVGSAAFLGVVWYLNKNYQKRPRRRPKTAYRVPRRAPDPDEDDDQ